ncbi:hypothetical protein P9314_19385 [Paenibacillus validus]|nr:hypothetical protein [Paenibacillus validus]MED4602801.1 hypothetical protein [Paenibacillus validus]
MKTAPGQHRIRLSREDGQKLNVPVYKLLGGKRRDRVSFASCLFF